ncbi:MAG: preprotein translocase subunit SecG [Lachnospiraceae bacterium]|nr:preprotein translocase subunit SecG [Lachnospiraceae bacterium]
MSGLSVFVTVIYIAFCVVMVILVLSQEGKQQGLGTIGGGNTDTYWAKIKGHTKEGMLPRLTAILASLFLLVSLLIDMNLFK